MCGIFGIIVNKESNITCKSFVTITKRLFKLSETRGKEASGFALSINDEITVTKKDISASKLLKTSNFSNLIEEKTDSKTIERPITLIGHSRMVTNGTQEIHTNNQPVIKDGMVIIHNGIIANNIALWKEFPQFKQRFEIDTEIIPTLINWYYLKKKSIPEAVKHCYKLIEGVATIAVLFENFDNLLLVSNNGSLYTTYDIDDKMFIFASEKYMLREIIKRNPKFFSYKINHIEAGTANLVSISDFMVQLFHIEGTKKNIKGMDLIEKRKKILDVTENKKEKPETFNIKRESKSEWLLEDNREHIENLNRCTRCLLPETFPFISYDSEGVCSICNRYKRIDYRGIDNLEKSLLSFKKTNDEPDIIVPLSGGRDSTFVLHYVKNELKMNPVAFTYDWGMVTDLARRNISRITSKLGVEHILISADINKKRRFIRKNVCAWLKRPRLGTVPLFMAGDKQFFYYANILKKQMNIDVILFGMNPLEQTDFKVGFTGVKESMKEERHYYLSTINKLKILFYYGKEFLLNLNYLNTSLIDSLFAFWSYYFIKHNYYIFFEYFKWDEEFINNTIIDRYNWETSSDTTTTWRIGDGTASFYNYIYYTVAGFTENDTFRSNQIRQGIIKRKQALKRVYMENKPRYEAIKWYCDTIGIDFEDTLNIINAIPKLYK
jgi:asparagine synthetase B (glutamine-hydrolysing)